MPVSKETMIAAVTPELLDAAYRAFVEASLEEHNDTRDLLDRIQSATDAGPSITVCLFKRVMALQNLIEQEGFLPQIDAGNGHLIASAITVAARLPIRETIDESQQAYAEFDRGAFLAALAQEGSGTAGSA